jgi:hypothetical protein
VLMMLGFILLIVPGFIVILTLFLFPFVIMDRRDLDLIEVLGETRRLMKAQAGPVRHLIISRFRRLSSSCLWHSWSIRRMSSVTSCYNWCRIG